ncbi:hypothetical protein IEO21_02313 [Rhodonia placenta]|uniref:F-box domain-containing protein n=1 Tax=Rhodonia placenta TaxID=104341 RepID=A0A8H7P7V1_9APHY|nr:hypothetical protein IEO21_02313 [Postia placenta]
MQSKRPLSPASLPPSKRLHGALSSSSSNHNPRPTFDTLFYDEIILSIFSYLPWTDLCSIQSTNRNWARLSLDNQLWKALYLKEYGRTRLRGVRGFIGRMDGREVRPLPGRAKSEEMKDWKWMFRISSNWRTGRCSVAPLDASTERPLEKTPLPEQNAIGADDGTCLLLAGSLTISARTCLSTCPVISLSLPTHQTYTLRCPPRNSTVSTRITTLALDQSPPSSTHTIRLISFLETGEFTIFSVNHHTPSLSSQILTHVPTGRNQRASPIIQAVYHHPLLVTLSSSFRLSLYDLQNNTVAHTQTLMSFTSYPPSSLVLSVLSPSIYKLIVAYAIPVYPSHWSVGATELMISGRAPDRMTVTGTRTTRAIDIPQGWMDETKMSLVREQWDRKVARVADTQTDGKWVVLAPGDPLLTRLGSDKLLASDAPSAPPSPSGTPQYASSSLHTATSLQLYRLYFPSSASVASAPKLTFVRNLHGHVGPVSALALADGRCVSLGVDGGMWVWDLEGGTGAEASSDFEASQEEEIESLGVRGALSTKGSIVFDERRIISADAGGVRVWRFDV